MLRMQRPWIRSLGPRRKQTNQTWFHQQHKQLLPPLPQKTRIIGRGPDEDLQCVLSLGAPTPILDTHFHTPLHTSTRPHTFAHVYTPLHMSIHPCTCPHTLTHSHTPLHTRILSPPGPEGSRRLEDAPGPCTHHLVGLHGQLHLVITVLLALAVGALDLLKVLHTLG